MTPERWRQLERLYHRALALDEEGRRALVMAKRRRDPELAQRLAALLEEGAPGGGEDRLAQAVEEGVAQLASELDDSQVGRRFGPWRVLRRLDEGGMSTVYLAERADRQFHKRVAFKLVRAGLDHAAIRRRFALERRILASLEHPNIARLLDAGTSDEGRPYFVMELVEGLPLDDYCDRHRLTVDERLELLLGVCAAVAYAHRNLVVHRDLKPSNVLVTGEGVAKLLDFGIAELLNPELTGEAEGEAEGAPPLRLLTPAYASPEQLAGEPVTTASDVYSLGVLLYELLCGRRPLAATGDRPDQMARRLREGELPPPSTRLGGESETAAAEIARCRGATAPRLRRRLRGDLDAIALSALAAEPRQRYPSVEALAGDLQRHLERRPVSARKPTVPYRLRRLVGRHRLGAAALLAALLLGASLVLTLVLQSQRLARERDAAERQRQRAEHTTELLIDLFRVAEPGEEPADEISARQLLDRAAERVAAEVRADPVERAVLLEAVGRIYLQQGHYQQAAPLLEESLALRRLHLGKDHPEVATALNRLAVLRAQSGDYNEAEALFRQALELRRRILHRDHPELAASLNNLALILHEQGEYATAEPLYREALATAERIRRPDEPEVVVELDNLGLLLYDLGRLAEAERCFREALARLRRQAGGRRPMAARVQVNLGSTVGAAGRLPEGERLLRQAVAELASQLGDHHPEVALARFRLAELLRQSGELAEADRLHRQVLAVQRQRLGDDHPVVAATLTGLGRTLALAGDSAGAEALLSQALELYRQVQTPGHLEIAVALSALGELLLDRGEVPAARQLLEEALAIRRHALPPADPRIAEVEALLKGRSPPG